MDSSVSAKGDIWFLRVYLHISTGIYHLIIAARGIVKYAAEGVGGG